MVGIDEYPSVVRFERYIDKCEQWSGLNSTYNYMDSFVAMSRINSTAFSMIHSRYRQDVPKV